MVLSPHNDLQTDLGTGVRHFVVMAHPGAPSTPRGDACWSLIGLLKLGGGQGQELRERCLPLGLDHYCSAKRGRGGVPFKRTHLSCE